MKITLIVGLAIGITISLLSLIIYFLVSTEIYHDYVSAQVLVSRNISIVALPEWTTCKGLWPAMHADFIIRIIFLTFVTVVLVKLIRTGGNMKRISYVTLLLSIVSFLFVIFYFLASSDIYHDYVSQKALISQHISVAALPEWTSCKGEWGILQIDLYIRIIFMILVTAVLIKLISNTIKEHDPSQDNTAV